MARQRLDRETRRAVLGARQLIEDVAKADGNEAETRRRVERIFESVMGYDVFEHVSREHAVRGAGETEHCDFAIQLGEGEDLRAVIMVELKRVNIDLAPKHLKQVSSYAINAGCEWIVLTNGKEWRLYHVSFGQPPVTKLLDSWDLLHDEPAVLARKFDAIGYRNVKKGGLQRLWEKTNVLTQRNLLRAILSEGSLKLIRRELRRSTGVLVTPEEVVGALRRLLNEAAISEMESVKISLPERKRPRRAPAARPAPAQQEDDPEPEPPAASDDEGPPAEGGQAPAGEMENAE